MHTSPAIILIAFALVLVGVNSQCSGPAKYRVSNVCNWTSRSHPTDYPSNAHFSPFCGTVHNASYTMFEVGGNATDGVQQVAETGMCGILEGEIDACVMEGSCNPDSYFSWMCYTPSNTSRGVCSHSGMIYLTPEYSYFSGISMIAPSPDWFVGMSANLCVENEMTGEYEWIERYPSNRTAHLYSHDAGTDSGTTFNSTDEPTDPREPIYIFDAKNETNIFYNQEAGRLYPLCRMMLEKA